MRFYELSLRLERLAILKLPHLLEVPVLPEQLALHVIIQLAKLLISLVEYIGLILLNPQRQFQYKYFVHFTFTILLLGVINTNSGSPSCHVILSLAYIFG